MGEITVVGLGYEIGQLTLDAVDLLRNGARIILHTGRCGCAEWLAKEGLSYDTLDELYESCEDFDEHARAAAEAVCAAAQDQDVVYGVFDVRDRSVAALMDMRKNVRVVAGPPMEGALFARAKGAVEMLEASDWESYTLSSARNALIREMDSRELASEVKLKLMEIYPDETAVFVRFGNGSMARTELYNLDRLKGYDHRTCALVTAEDDLTHLERFDFDRLCEVLDVLCAPDGCPWCADQTHQSLRSYVLEEAYEIAGAIDDDDPYQLCDELGDMLMQVVLHAEIGKRYGEFGIGDVISAIGEKLVQRSSYVFGKDKAMNSEEANHFWQQNKMAERGEQTLSESFRSVPKSLPATLRAGKLLKRLEDCCGRNEGVESAMKAAKMGIQRIEENPSVEVVGEALFRLVALARAANMDPEAALSGACRRFIARFEEFEAKHDDLKKASPEELEKCWNFVKLF